MTAADTTTSERTAFTRLVHERRSIRGFKADPVPRELIDKIIQLAIQCPSSMNTQPWHFHVVTGDPLDHIREGNTEKMMAGAAPDREIAAHEAYRGEHRERQKVVAGQLFEAMGIGWDDKEKRQDWAMRGFRQFDAPVSVVGCIDRDLGGRMDAFLDLGQAVYGLTLAAHAYGLGTVINGQGIMQSSVVRDHANIPEDQLIVITVALGYPADDFPANEVDTPRRPVDEVATYVGFPQDEPAS